MFLEIKPEAYGCLPVRAESVCDQLKNQKWTYFFFSFSSCELKVKEMKMNIT